MQNLQRQLLTKDEQITELMHEGERLSKQELKQGTIIKKLRTKEKEQEKAIEALQSRLAEIDHLKEKLREKREQEIKYDGKWVDEMEF
jgi:ppGpp synthetase/RelA/SpoT-type nucleotidyltranferase